MSAPLTRRIQFSRQTVEAHVRERIRELRAERDTAKGNAFLAAAAGHTALGEVVNQQMITRQIAELNRLLDHWGLKP